MSSFLLILERLIPLYILICIGFCLGRLKNVPKEAIADLLINSIIPVVIFYGVSLTPITVQTLSLPVLFFLICTAMSLLFYNIAGFFFKDSNRNLIGFMSGSGNTGYFGLPLALALFGNDIQGYAVLIIKGIVFFENTVGYFMIARGNFSITESLKRIFKLPAVYAFCLGCLVSLSGITFSKTIGDFAASFRGAYTVLGMMLIGLGLSGLQKLEFNIKFTVIANIGKFIAWPLIMIIILKVDSAFFNIFPSAAQPVMLLMSMVPMAANTVVYATLLKIHPEKAAMTVLISTLVALIYLPIASFILFK